MIPYFNAGIFLENKKQIGKVDEILGPIKQYVSVQSSRLDCSRAPCSLVVLRITVGKHESKLVQEE